MPTKTPAKNKPPRIRYTKDHFADLDGQDVWYRDATNEKARGWLLWVKEDDRLELVLAGAKTDPVAISNRQLASIGDSESHRFQLIERP